MAPREAGNPRDQGHHRRLPERAGMFPVTRQHPQRRTEVWRYANAGAD